MLLSGFLRSWQSVAFILVLLLSSLISVDACECCQASRYRDRYSQKTGLGVRFYSEPAWIIYILEKRFPLSGLVDAWLAGWL